MIDGEARDYRNPNDGAPSWAEYAIIELYHSADIEAGQELVGSFGNDYIAGGPDHGMIFGQLGNDTIQGDGSIESAIQETNPIPVGAKREIDGTLTVDPSFEAVTDGDDYIEGNGGTDLIFGNLGQDDIIGGSSNLFSLETPVQRPDGADLLFGGAGTDITRNELGDLSDEGHARDADMILGDNGNIYRLVGTNGTARGTFLTFNYDNDTGIGGLKIIPRSVELLDYTPGGIDFDAAGTATDIGAADEIHGESGDDFIYGMVGLGANNSKGRIDNVSVQVLPPEITLENTEDFTDGTADLFTGSKTGTWQIVGDRLEAIPNVGDDKAINIIDLGLAQGLHQASILEFEATLNTQSSGGVVFDQYGPNDFKFAAINADTDQVIIGHYTQRRGWSIDRVADWTLEPGTDYALAISLKGTTISVTLDGQVVLGHVFNALLVDGGFGLLTGSGSSSFDAVTLRTDDLAFAALASEEGTTAPAESTEVKSTVAPSVAGSTAEDTENSNQALPAPIVAYGADDDVTSRTDTGGRETSDALSLESPLKSVPVNSVLTAPVAGDVEADMEPSNESTSSATPPATVDADHANAGLGTESRIRRPAVWTRSVDDGVVLFRTRVSASDAVRDVNTARRQREARHLDPRPTVGALTPQVALSGETRQLATRHEGDPLEPFDVLAGVTALPGNTGNLRFGDGGSSIIDRLEASQPLAERLLKVVGSESTSNAGVANDQETRVRTGRRTLHNLKHRRNGANKPGGEDQAAMMADSATDWFTSLPGWTIGLGPK